MTDKKEEKKDEKEEEKKYKKEKISRILNFYERFNQGEVIVKSKEVERFNVNEKTIQRDIETLRCYFDETSLGKRHIKYDRKINGYKINNKLGYEFGDRDIFVLLKIVLESRAFTKEEMNRIINILKGLSEDKNKIEKMISNDQFNYMPPKHNRNIIDFIWNVNYSIRIHREVKVKYRRQDNKVKEYYIRPLGLVFSEYYFYVIGEIVGRENNHSIVFRVDRFEEYEITDNKFIPYEEKLKEGEFSKRIQFMYTGELMSIQFKFWGDSLEAILDRLPTATVVEERYDDGKKVALINAEVYGEGVKRWLLSQKEFLEVVRPESYRNEIKETIRKMYELYK